MKTKAAWRAHYLEQRRALTVEERVQKSHAITEYYFNLFERERPEVVHLFLSMPAKSEVDTRFVLQRLNQEYPQVKTVTSVIAENQISMLTIEVRMDTPLVLNNWGIPEPTTRIVFPEQEIQEVLTPLLAMDAEGIRLGYGKGFYDRFFVSCSSSVKRTGINFFPIVHHELPKDSWDIALHRLVSADGIFAVNEKA
ncbi:MAG: 5-formyltetrahydrofolate cyclo-ligase [Cytophagaceae bacterium]|nr:5-formyltetrahydrofolate cyclo-ligase [Cytophagaceae bacterium]